MACRRRSGSSQCGAGTSKRGDAASGTGGMDADEICLSDHLDVIRAASAHPAIGEAGDGYPSDLRLFDKCLSSVIHHQHADVVAAIVKGGYLRFVQHLHWITRACETPMLGNVQDLRETGIFITVQGCVDHMVG